MDLAGYKKYLTNWLAGLENEIDFWNCYMKDEGGDLFLWF